MTLPARKPHLKLVHSTTDGSADLPVPFQDMLVARGQVSPDDMFRAIALQQRENATLSDLLQALGMVSESAMQTAQADAARLPVVDLDRDPPDGGLDDGIDPARMIRLRFLPWRRTGDTVLVVIADPDARADILPLVSHLAPSIAFALAPRGQVTATVAARHRAALSAAANRRTPAALSCRGWSGRRPALVGMALLATLLLALALVPQGVMFAAFGWVALTLVLNGCYKIVALRAALSDTAPPHRARRPDRLPRVSIMVPLLRETDILERLIRRMSRLVYPKELLDICLVYEANDTQTRDHLLNRSLPYWMRTVEVPVDTLQTKPRAMNYALDFCKGDVIGIYDAEDAPEPDQIFTVVRRLAGAPDDVACVQCRLDYYNSTTNWMSRCFAIEYAILFRVILPGLERMRLPVPLGGTSVFFRRDALEKLGRWDAQNVTEDADLGYRLHRAGYRCLIADSTTYEEANYRLVPWIKQRSRWLKGFVQTWMTHMRNPVRLWRDLGPGGFVAFQAEMLGTVSSFAMAPLVLPMWLLSLGVTPAFYDALPPPMLVALIVGFVCTELFLLLLGTIAMRRRPDGGFGLWVLTMPAYWPLGAFAAFKAIWELFARPSYWDKTAHGINDADYQAEIDKLTSLPLTTNDAVPGAVITSGG